MQKRNRRRIIINALPDECVQVNRPTKCPSQDRDRMEPAMKIALFVGVVVFGLWLLAQLLPYLLLLAGLNAAAKFFTQR